MILESKLAWAIKEVVDDFLTDALYRLVIGTGYWQGPLSAAMSISDLASRTPSLWVHHLGDNSGSGVIKSVRWCKPLDTAIIPMHSTENSLGFIPYCHENKGKDVRPGL